MRSDRPLVAFLDGVGLIGPGLPDWAIGRSRLAAGAFADDVDTFAAPPPTLLPANERRRAGLPVRLALSASLEAVAGAALDPATLRAVFGSANGEALILHELLEQLASGETLVSPTRFHNSVHNAVAGYWAIGVDGRAPLTCVGGHDDTASAVLLKALAEARAENVPVLACAYDAPLPDPLAAKRPTEAGFAAAFVLAPERSTHSLARIEARWRSGRTPARKPRWSNAAARALDLLGPLARGEPAADIAWPLGGGTLLVSLAPCSTDASSRA